MTETPTGDSDLMQTLEELAGQGRVPVEDLAVEDPRLRIRTPAGVIRTNRTPDYVRKEGSSTIRKWNFGPYRVEEDRDWQPGLETNHAVVVEKRNE